MSFKRLNIFKLGVEYEDEFGKIHPEVLTAAEVVWEKSGEYFSNIIRDQAVCMQILLHGAALVTSKYNSGNTDIKKLIPYLYSTFRHLLLAEIRTRKRHGELEDQFGRKQIESTYTNANDEIYLKVLINQIRERMDSWTCAVFDLLALGYRYNDLTPEYGSSANVIRSKYSKNIQKLKIRIQSEISNIEEALDI